MTVSWLLLISTKFNIRRSLSMSALSCELSLQTVTTVPLLKDRLYNNTFLQVVSFSHSFRPPPLNCWKEVSANMLYPSITFKMFWFSVEILSFFVFVFGLNPPLTLYSEIQGCARLLGEPLGLWGKEVVFSEMEWPGFKPRTSSIRRGRSIHSTTPHLAFYQCRCVF